MPAGPGSPHAYDSQDIYPNHGGYSHYDNHGAPNDVNDVNGDESAASILQSVREQEAQFEQLTRELEEERQTVVTQLEKCKFGSETASMSSISSTDESFHWRPPPVQEAFEEESDADSKMSGSHLVDSCLRVLQERGLMNVGDDPLEGYVGDPSASPRFPNSSDLYGQQDSPHNGSMNGPAGYYDPRNQTNSPNPSLQSGNSMTRNAHQRTQVTTVTKVTTTHHVQRIDGGHSQSPQPQDPNYSNYSPYSPMRGSQNQMAPSPGQGPQHSPGGSMGNQTPTRFGGNTSYEGLVYGQYNNHDPEPEDHFYQRYDGHPNEGYEHSFEQSPKRYDSIDQQFPHRNDGYPDDRNRSYGGGPPSDAGSYRDRAPYGNGPEPYSGPYDGNRDNYSNPPQIGGPGNRDYVDGPGSYRGTPPVDDRYRTNESFQGAPPMEPQGDGYNGPQGYGNGPVDDPYNDRSYNGEPYPRQDDDRMGRATPSPAPGSDRYGGTPRYDSQQGLPQGLPHSQDGPRGPYDGQDGPPYNPEYPDDSIPRMDGPQNYGPPPDGFDPDLMDAPDKDRWRNPDLPEVIEYLSHPNNAIKANAAAYLQHLCFMDDPIKAKTRALNGIPALVELVNNEIPEVHRAACGALKNLSYGRANDENKREIKNAGGIPALCRLLRKSPDNDIRELVTGILWNLSSCPDLKKPIIDDGLAVLVTNVIVPHSGWGKDNEHDLQPKDVYWTTVFRNASGVLRNISSEGDYGRKKLRECEGLVDSILYIVKAAIGKNDIDNKSVENCVCILRNLSYACQEVEDIGYLKRRAQPKQPQKTQGGSGSSTGCFGGKKKKPPPDQKSGSNNGYPGHKPDIRGGMALLWHPDVVHIYMPLLSDCSNPETLEAAAGAIQNLAACDWQPSVDIRAAVRKEKGLPIIVELLSIEADRVVCAAATALRNLALDERNKELIGKYAMRNLVLKLPSENRAQEYPTSDETITAVEATLYEVIKKNSDFAQTLLREGGVERLVYITRSHKKFSSKVVKFAASLLYTMWQFKELHPEYRNMGLKESHFVTRTMAAKGGPSTSADNTLNRPRQDMGGPGNYNTAVPINRQPPPHDQQNMGNHAPPSPAGNHMGNHAPPPHMGYEGYDSGYNTRARDDRLQPDDIPMHQMSLQDDHHNFGSPGYATIESNRGRGGDDYRQGTYPSQQQNLGDSREPLYAQVNKQSKQRRPDQSPYGSSNQMMLEGAPSHGQGGADSWV